MVHATAETVDPTIFRNDSAFYWLYICHVSRAATIVVVHLSYQGVQLVEFVRGKDLGQRRRAQEMAVAVVSSAMIPVRRVIGSSSPSQLSILYDSRRRARSVSVCAVQETKEAREPASSSASSSSSSSSSSSPLSSSADEATEKFGLEFGLWKIFSSNDGEKGESTKSKADQAKELLAKYGGAYLATSISLSLVSFSLCYLLVSAGIDVQSLLQKVGIAADATGEKVGTFALAYAAHKAASPIRFPPTVALTPIVASWIGKKPKEEK